MAWWGIGTAEPDEFRVTYSDFSIPTDLSEEERLAGIAEDVFYGVVIDKKGSRVIDELPETQWNVRVERVFKGDVADTINVNQQGGYDPVDNTLILMEGDALLVPGKRYLFATRWNSTYKFNTLVPVYGDQMVPNTTAPAPGAPDSDGDGTSTITDVWLDAVEHQIPYTDEPDTSPEPTDEPSEQPSDVPTGEPEVEPSAS